MNKTAFFIAAPILIAGCGAQPDTTEQENATEDLVATEYPEAEAEVQAVLDDIQAAIRDNDMDRLIAHHAYGPKFSDFQNAGWRTGSEENEANERGFFGNATAINRFEYVDPQVSVYGDVAVASVHADVDLELGGEQIITQRQLTLVFVRTEDGWKIVHEHNSPLEEQSPLQTGS